MNIRNTLLESLDELMIEILKIPGEKIITLANQDQHFFTVDVSQEGVFGYQPGIKELFLAKLMSAFQKSGSIIIREFLSIKVKTVVPNGKEMWIPEKNLYGIILEKGAWRGLSHEVLQQCCSIDAVSGSPIDHEKGVHYRDFPLDE